VSNRHLRGATAPGVRPGTFAKARLSKTGQGGYVTIVVEGNDEGEPSVSAVALNAESVDILIRRLRHLRANFT
jgi:hypothetical protein